MLICAGHLVEAEELVMVNNGSFQPVHMTPVDRPSGQNDVGIVAWLLTLKTPECPQGRQASTHSCPRSKWQYDAKQIVKELDLTLH